MRQEEPSYFEDEEDFISYAQSYFAKGFPNPLRDGCLCIDAQTLSDYGAVDQELLKKHLMTCSECFNEYQFTIIKSRWQTEEKQTGQKVKRHWFATGKMRLAITGFTALLVGGIVVAALLNSRQPVITSNANVVRNVANHALVNDQGKEKQVVEKSQPGKSADGEERKSELLAANTVNIDFRNARRGKSEKQNRALLKLGINRLVLRLPNINPVGVYEASITDAFGKSLLPPRPCVRRGDSLVVEFDVSGLKPANYELMIAHVDNAPYNYQIAILPQVRKQ